MLETVMLCIYIYSYKIIIQNMLCERRRRRRRRRERLMMGRVELS
jgi:hypothetical protein